MAVLQFQRCLPKHQLFVSSNLTLITNNQIKLQFSNHGIRSDRWNVAGQCLNAFRIAAFAQNVTV